jgi:hypothetical protein
VRLLQSRIKHRDEVARRRVDNPEHLGGCGLLLQRLARFGQEPRVLHRHDRLRGEAFEQRDLPVGERAHFLSDPGDDTQHGDIFAKWQPEQGADIVGIDDVPNWRRGIAIEIGSAGVGQVDDPLTVHKACQSASLGRTHWAHLARGFDKSRLPVGGSKTEFFSVADEQHAVCSTAQYVRLFEDCLEYWGEIAGRGVDHLQYFSDRRALG